MRTCQPISTLVVIMSHDDGRAQPRRQFTFVFVRFLFCLVLRAVDATAIAPLTPWPTHASQIPRARVWCACMYLLRSLRVVALKSFYLKSYHGTELEDQCTACVVKPPDDVCNACDVDAYHASILDPTLGLTNNSGFISDEQLVRRSVVVGSNSRNSSSSNHSSASISASSMGLSEECEACVVSHHACFLEGEGWGRHTEGVCQ